MSNKYTIKNCPALRGWVCNEQFIRQDKMVDCQDCTDCIMKQIVELCKEYSNKWEDCDFSNGFGLEDEILELLDIEDVE